MFSRNFVFLVARKVYDGNELMTAQTACKMIEVGNKFEEFQMKFVVFHHRVHCPVLIERDK